MRTRIEVAPGADRSEIYLRGDVLTPRILSATPAGARVALVGTQMVLLAGDSIGIDIVVAPGGRLEIVEPVGTVAYGGTGRSRWEVSIEVGAGATLIWEGQPFVVSDGATVLRTTDIRLGDGARLLQREVLAFGRSGQHGGDLVSCLHARSADGLPLLIEDLDLARGKRERLAVLGDDRVLDSIIALGWRPEGDIPAGPAAFELAEPGVLLRQLGREHAHQPMDACWQAWRGQDALSGRSPGPATAS